MHSSCQDCPWALATAKVTNALAGAQGRNPFRVLCIPLARIVRGRWPRLSTSFHKFGNAFPTPSPGPPRLVKAPAAGHPLPRGERVRRFDSDPCTEPQPSPLAGEGGRGTRAGEGLNANDERGRIR